MITFVPKIRSVENPLSQAKEWVANLGNENLSKQLIARFEKYRCSKHSNFGNSFEVDLYDEKLIITLTSYCCEDFKKHLILIEENKDPFTGNNKIVY